MARLLQAAQWRLRQRCLRDARVVLAAMLAMPLGLLAGQTAHKLPAPPALSPGTRIPVEPLGFRAPSRFYLTYRVPSATLDFIDDDHLLFTFHKTALMRREDKEPEEDEDQTIAAVVLDVRSAKAVEQVDWRLHDKSRYLWALEGGRFLQRERNSLYLLDRSLQARTPFLQTPGSILSVELSPDRSRLLVQYQEPLPAKTAGNGDQSGGPAPTLQPTLGTDAPPRRAPHQVRLLVVNTRAARVEHSALLPHAVALPLVEDGYLDLRAGKGKQWKVMLTPFGGEPRQIAELSSGCQPMLHPLNREVYLAELCAPATSDHLMQAYNVDGKKLWEQQWESRYVWGFFAYAENGSRFGYESIQLDHPLAALDTVDETAITGQPVGVFDVADGTLRLVAGAEPILSAGQNFALSADGRRFAVLRKGAIEVYDLPPPTSR